MPVSILELEFKGLRRGFFGNFQCYPFLIGDYALVQVEKGTDLGRIHRIYNSKVTNGEEITEVFRKAVIDDLVQLAENKTREEAALIVCREKAIKWKLDMKVVDVEYQFDRNKITFYFTADHRVDFRELVKDLAQEYRTRIELRQIGVRDEARRVGGCGVCGLQMCCTTCIRDFQPISTQFAKDQGLSLNPSKLAGACGRLKCCLRYEKDQYLDAIERFPEIDTAITTERGQGFVDKLDIFRNLVYLRYPNDEWERLTLDEVNSYINPRH